MTIILDEAGKLEAHVKVLGLEVQYIKALIEIVELKEGLWVHLGSAHCPPNVDMSEALFRLVTAAPAKRLLAAKQALEHQIMPPL